VDGPLGGDDVEPEVTTARVARYATADHYGRLEAGLGAMADELRALGHRAVVVADDNALVDREAAWRAGIGWYGKNSLLLVPGRGSWFVLGSVVTDAVIDDIPQPVADGCAGCTRCIEGCPTDAIVAPGVVDARRCLAWLLQAPGTFPVEFRAALGDRIYGCDDCQEVCPPNRTVELRANRTEPWPREDEPGTHVDACELLDLDDDALLDRCARWYIPKRDAAVVRRNLLIVLGNSGRGTDRRVRSLLDRYRSDPDPVLAEHARWAIDQLSRIVAL
jgi:epoxyqueuosine reductase